MNSEDFYLNEQGLLVFTRSYHLKRGSCCGSGCLHCPYAYIGVKDEGKRKLLLERSKTAHQ